VKQFCNTKLIYTTFTNKQIVDTLADFDPCAQPIMVFINMKSLCLLITKICCMLLFFQSCQGFYCFLRRLPDNVWMVSCLTQNKLPDLSPREQHPISDYL